MRQKTSHRQFSYSANSWQLASPQSFVSLKSPSKWVCWYTRNSKYVPQVVWWANRMGQDYLWTYICMFPNAQHEIECKFTKHKVHINYLLLFPALIDPSLPVPCSSMDFSLPREHILCHLFCLRDGCHAKNTPRPANSSH